jgi:phosphoglycerate dehydrogenase-like enzyme
MILTGWSMRIAIIDDYQASAFRLADWSSIPNATVVPFTDHVYDETQLINRLSEFDAVLRIRERTEFPRSTLERLPKLKLLLATGMRNARSIDLPAARELGITVCTTDAYHQTTVEITWGLILMLMRRMSVEASSLRNGGWQLGLGLGLAGKTLGILGLGNMGQPVAKIGQGFGMNVVAWSPNLTPERASEHGVKCVTKSELFSNSDVVTIHVPHSDTTEGIVSAADIANMKRSAYLINTSRPKLVDQAALIDALSSGRIAGAGLDVFDIEPLPHDHPYRYLQNVVATPHIGFVTEENYRLFFEQSIENARAFLEGKPIRVIS